MKPKKRSHKPLPLALVVETVIALHNRPENKDFPLETLIEPAINFLRAAEHLIAERKSEK